jgi:hypothetical protein
VDKKPEELGHGVTMEEVQEVFFKGTTEEVLERAVGIIEDTQNQHKRGSQTLDVCFNLEIVRLMVKEVKKNCEETVNG